MLGRVRPFVCYGLNGGRKNGAQPAGEECLAGLLPAACPATIRKVVVEEVKTASVPEVASLGQPSYVWRFGLERRLATLGGFPVEWPSV